MLAGNQKVASSIPRFLQECRGVSERRRLTLSAPDERAVDLHARLRRRCVNVHQRVNVRRYCTAL